MVERTLPAGLEFAARDEDHVGVFEAGHVAGKVAAVPRSLHPRDGAQDRRPVGDGRGQQRERDQAHSWNWPTMTVWHWPPRMTRSPSMRHWSRPPRLLAWSAVNSVRPSRSAQ